MLQELMKQHMGDGPTDDFLEANESLTLSLYLHFFVALAHETTRVNGAAVAGCAENRWKSGKQKSHLFGSSLEKAFSYAKKAGDKAVDGTKLTSEVKQMYFAMTGRIPGEASAVKEEPTGQNPGEASAVKVKPSAVKVEASAVKVEPGFSHLTYIVQYTYI